MALDKVHYTATVHAAGVWNRQWSADRRQKHSKPAQPT